jgi:hypothetical protein
MKSIHITLVLLFMLPAATAAFAQQAVTMDAASEPVEALPQHQPVDQSWIMQHGMDRHQQHAGMRHGSQHGGGKHGKGRHEKHEQVVKRLDLIEARLAKIEAMLEIMMRR